MDLSQIRELLKIVAESGVAEVEIEEDDFKLVVRLNSPNVSIQSPPQYPIPPAPSSVPYYPMPLSPLPPSSLPAHHVPPSEGPPAPTEPVAPAPGTASTNEHIIKAPIVGTFYRASSPDADPFVQVGDVVKPGDVLCIIEAMKLMNEIECEVAGTIKNIVIENSEPVEYDQPLFVIEQN